MAAALKPASVTFTAVAALATTIGIGAILLSPHLRTCAGATDGVIACMQGAVQDVTASVPQGAAGKVDASAIETPSVAAVPVDIAPAPVVTASREDSSSPSFPPAASLDVPSVAASRETVASAVANAPASVAISDATPELDATVVDAIPPAPPQVDLVPGGMLGEMSAATSSVVPPMPAELQPPASRDMPATPASSAPNPPDAAADVTVGSPAPQPAEPPAPLIPKRNSASISTLRTVTSPSVTTLGNPAGPGGSIVVPRAPRGSSGHFTTLSRPDAGAGSITSLD